MELSERLHERVQVMVTEYTGALAPGRVIAIAVGAAAQLHRSGGQQPNSDDFIQVWEDSARRRLGHQVAAELASLRRAQERQRVHAA